MSPIGGACVERVASVCNAGFSAWNLELVFGFRYSDLSPHAPEIFTGKEPTIRHTGVLPVRSPRMCGAPRDDGSAENVTDTRRGRVQQSSDFGFNRFRRADGSSFVDDQFLFANRRRLRGRFRFFRIGAHVSPSCPGHEAKTATHVPLHDWQRKASRKIAIIGPIFDRWLPASCQPITRVSECAIRSNCCLGIRVPDYAHPTEQSWETA